MSFTYSTPEAQIRLNEQAVWVNAEALRVKKAAQTRHSIMCPKVTKRRLILPKIPRSPKSRIPIVRGQYNCRIVIDNIGLSLGLDGKPCLGRQSSSILCRTNSFDVTEVMTDDEMSC